MKKTSILFVSLLSLAALSGCKKKGGDCSGTINGMMDRMMAEGMKEAGSAATPEMKKQAEDMMKKMSEPMVKVCTDDKWSAEALKCMEESTSKDDPKKCDAMLTAEQRTHLETVSKAAMGMGEKMEPKAEPKTDKPADGSAAMAGSAGSAAPAAAGDLPAECNDYKAAIEKLSACDKMPKEARDAMKSAFDQASTSWAGLPAEAKASLATACKAGADAVKQSSAAMCP